MLQEINLVVHLSVLNFLQTLGEIMLAQLREMYSRSHCLDCCIPHSVMDESVCTKAVFLVLLVDLLEVKFAHPLVNITIDHKLMGHDFSVFVPTVIL